MTAHTVKKTLNPAWSCARQARQPQRGGFSLLEMLVVVALMAVLLGLSVAILSGMKEKARAGVTRDTARQLAEAWTRYLQMNGEWPPGIAGTPETTKIQADGDHLKLLNKLTKKDDKYNPEPGFFLLEVKKEEIEGVTGKKKDGLLDSWGNRYVLWFDTDYDGQIKHPQRPEKVKTAVIVASPGKDGKFETKDDVIVF